MDRQQATRLIETLFVEWGPFLARYAYRLTSDRELADDLVQEAFMALYQACRRDTEIENPRAWTLSVVRHLAAKGLRDRIRRGETLTTPEDLSRFEDSRPGPAAEAEDDVTELFAVLSKREEEVVLMRIESQKYREIAAALKISQKTVETLLARALRKLREAAKAKSAGRPLPTDQEKNVPKTLQ